jgi:hypothetical protein
MTLPGNGTLKKIIATVIAGVLLILVTAVLANQNRVTALEVKIQGIETAQTRMADQIETSRKENREEHQRILDEIKGLKK